MKVWVTMGYFDDRGDGAIVELDTASGEIREVLRFDPPPSLRVPRKGFTGAAWLGSDLLVCGGAAVFRFDGQTLAHNGTLAQPSFNDLHGLCVGDDRIFVCNTGLDCVDVFDHGGTFLGSHTFEAAWLTRHRIEGAVPSRSDWSALRRAGWLERSFDLEHDEPSSNYYDGHAAPFHLRKQRDFVHPNHVVTVGPRLLVTCLQARCVYDLSRFEAIFETACPGHDGVVLNEQMWLTRVDGVVEARSMGDPVGASETIDITARTGVAGWCRGLLVSAELLFVGFTEMREVREQAWSRAPLAETRTAVVCVDRASGELVRRFDLSDGGRHGKVFAIVEAP